MIVDDYVPAAVLTGFVRTLPQPYMLQLNRYLPDRQIGDIEAAIDQVQKTNRAAEFRAWDSETPVGPRESFSRTKVKMPPLGIKRPIGEQERLMLERARVGGDNRNAYVQAIYDDAALGVEEVYRRMELARGDALDDGVFTITENGLSGITADFSVPGSNFVAAATTWDDHDDASPLQELRAWVQAYIDLNGQPPGRMVGSNKILMNLLQSDEVKGLFPGNVGLGSGPNLITRQQLNNVFALFDLPPFEVYDSRIEKLAGGTERVLKEHKLHLLPANPADLGFTAWGITAEALELNQGGNPGLLFSQLPGLVGVVLKEGDPLRVWTKVGAVGMPMITGPRTLMVASVLPPS